MAAGGGGEGDTGLRDTPTWVVALICSIIVFISLVAERSLHSLGKKLKKKNQKPLYEALLKVKEELMLLGFISLLLVAFQSRIIKLCVPQTLMNHMLPCKKENNSHQASTTEHLYSSIGRSQRQLAAGGEPAAGYCYAKNKVPLMSLSAIHALHIFIFILAVTHVIFCAFTMVLGLLKIYYWKSWEECIQQEDTQRDSNRIIIVHQLEFIKERYKGLGKRSGMMRWMFSFFKQFYGTVTKADYETMRLGFIMTHCRGNPNFNFYNYMTRVLEADFKKVVGISWYLWIFVIIFFLINVDGWRAYFWLSFLPLILLLAVGTKLEYVITELAHDVAQKHVVVEGDLIINPSDDHFWFHRPKIVLNIIHFILFQNAFEISFFFWIWTTFGFTSCFMGGIGYVIPRLVVGFMVQIFCSYSTLPLYAIVTQMGSSFRKAIFDENIQLGLVDWAKKVKTRVGARATQAAASSSERSKYVLLEKMEPKSDPQHSRQNPEGI